MTRDEAVQSAIDNWAPRFLANGIDYNDFQRVTSSVEKWDDWCAAWSACGDVHKQMGVSAALEGAYVSAAYHYFHAAIAYHFGKFLFARYPEQLRAAHENVISCYTTALHWFDPPAERVLIPYENGLYIAGILRKPWHVPSPPVVILVPGLDSVKEELHIYGDDFLRRGMAVLAIDGPGQGELEFAAPLRPDYEVPIRHVIDYLNTRNDLNARKVGLMGVSFGGQFAVRAAAFEPRLLATIANCGAYDMSANFAGRPRISQETLVMRLHASSDADAAQKLLPFNLNGVAERVKSPLLVIQGRRDRLVPAEQGERIAAEAHAELWLFEDGNHVCNNIPFKHRPQQADWMREKLLDR